MRNDLLIGIGATLIAMALFYFSDQNKKEALNIKKNKIESEADFTVPVEVRPNTVSEPVQAALVAAPPAIKKLSSQDITTEEKEQIFINFSKHLQTIGQCLKIQNRVETEKIEPSYDNLLVSLKPALGELVVQLDDWSQIDLVSPDGTKKRIRTEVNYENPNAPVKFVQLYNINSQGFPEMVTLDAEKSRNPTDDYINYLKGGSESVLDEKGSRAYFPEGEEVVLIERGGRMESVSITKNGKTVTCSGLDTLQSNCQCP